MQVTAFKEFKGKFWFLRTFKDITFFKECKDKTSRQTDRQTDRQTHRQTDVPRTSTADDLYSLVTALQPAVHHQLSHYTDTHHKHTDTDTDTLKHTQTHTDTHTSIQTQTQTETH